jgi:C4-dicarboxylate-specific signal transduction histidine kinase
VPPHPSISWLHQPGPYDRPALRRVLLAAAALAVIAGSAWGGFLLSQHQGISTTRTEANHRLDLFASAVDGVVKRLESVPATVQLNQDVLSLLRHQGQ